MPTHPSGSPRRLVALVRAGRLAGLVAAVALAATVVPSRATASSAHPSALPALALPAAAGPVTQAYVDAVLPAPSSSHTPLLETALNPDGSLRSGLSGSFNAEGFSIAYGPDGGPRFVASAASSPQAGGYANFVVNAPNSTVYAIAVIGSDLYVGGQFIDAGGIDAADRVAKWDGTSWSALGSGVNNSVYAIALGEAEPAPAAFRSGSDLQAARAVQAPVPALYLGGDFTATGDGTPASYFTYYTGSEVLPVELVSFRGAASGRTARLSWTTASETNNAGFVVERQTGDSWTEASGLIAGQGTTTERTAYAFDVSGLTACVHTFRLRQTDTDGTIHHSATVTVEIGTDGETVVSILGNGSRAPRVRIEGSGAVRAEVYDVLGRSVATLYDGAVSGTVETSLPVLAVGAYVVRVVAGGRTTTERVVVR